MNQALRKYGLGGIAAAFLLAVAVIGVNSNKDAHAGVAQEWQVVEKSKLFLHDLTSQGATFVTALRIDEDGEVSGDIADLYELRFGHSEKGVDAHRSTLIVEPETEIDKAILFNPADYSVMVYMQVGQTIRELRLLSGEGIAVGEPSTLMTSEQQRGCRCVCTVSHPTGSATEVRYIACSEVEPGYEPGTPCDCESVNGDLCWIDPHVEDGAMGSCKSGWIPTGTDPGA